MASKEVNEQVKPIIIHDAENGIDYTLEFNRESVKFAEARGFDIEDVGRDPIVDSVAQPIFTPIVLNSIPIGHYSFPFTAFFGCTGFSFFGSGAGNPAQHFSHTTASSLLT